MTSLIPHRLPMLMLDDLLEYSADCGTARGRIGESNPFLRPDGRLDPLACIELIAQAAAAHEGYRRRLSGLGIGGGYLVGIRDFEPKDHLSAGEEFTVTARRGLRLDPLQLAQGAVTAGGRVVATGELKLFVSDRTMPAEMGLPSGEAVGLSREPRKRVFPVADFLTPAPARGRGASYRLDGTFPAFHGHFPGYPVLPALASAVLAAETIRAIEGTDRRIRRLRTAKFSKPVSPGSILHVVCEAEDSARPPSRTARIEALDVPVATITLEFD